MTRPLTRWPLWIGIAVLYLLHNDFWLWRDGRIVAGLPVGLVYHVAYCGVASLVMWLLVRHAWPAPTAPREEERR